MFNSDTFSLSRVTMSGVLAGLVFALFVTLGALVTGGPAHAFTPLRMIAAIGLGPAALEPSYSPLVAVGAGVALHLVLSAGFAVIFASMIPVTFSTATEVGLGMAYGFVLWLFNFYLIGPTLGWVWFAEQSSPLVQLTAHTVGFGAVLGWLRHHAWEVSEANVDAKLHEWHALN